MAAPKQFSEVLERSEVRERVLELKSEYPVGILSDISVASLFENMGLTNKNDLFRVQYKVHMDG